MPASYKPRQTSSYGGRKKKAPPPAPAIYHQKISPMLVQDGTKADIKAPTKRQHRKFDGTRSFVVKDFDDVQIMGSRNWVNDYGKNHPELVDAVRKLPVDRTILDAEFTFFKKGTDRDFFLNALAAKETIEKEGVEAKLVIFDVLYVDSDNLQQLPFDDRDEILHTIIPEDTKYLIVPKTVKNVVQKEKQFQELEKRKLEGVVEKEAESPYRQGEKTPEWTKVKNWKSDEAIVVGYTKGENSRSSTFGALILAQRDKQGKLRYIGRAAGLKNFELAALLKKMQALKTTKTPLAVVPEDVKALSWVKPELVIEVKYLNRTPNGVLRMPDFLRERPDKPTSQVTLPN
jgi:bifunctional non-homologous end joining protein LigD